MLTSRGPSYLCRRAQTSDNEVYKLKVHQSVLNQFECMSTDHHQHQQPPTFRGLPGFDLASLVTHLFIC